MALPQLQQAKILLEKAPQVLLLVPERSSADALASMIALYLVLETVKQDGIDEVSPRHVLPQLQFLPGSSQVKMQPRSHSEIILDVAGPTTITDSWTEKLQGGLRLHIGLPPKVDLTKDQIEVSLRNMPYDAVVIFGASDLEEIGQLFTDHADFFYHTPIINIDHRADNEHFGTVNLVDITAGSVAEVTYDLITTITGEELSIDVATALYAGIIAGTDSFQRPGTTPRSFQVAARLMSLKADRESVIQHLVKTKPLPLLKLTGRLYARLRVDEHVQLFWSITRPIDFAESGASAADLQAAMYELSNNIAGFNVAFVLNELAAENYEVLIMLGKGLLQRRAEIQETLSAKRDNGILRLNFTSSSLEEAEKQALEQIRAILP